MTRSFLLATVFVALSHPGNAQFYMSAGARYYLPFTTQEAPEYFNAAIIVSTGSGDYLTEIINYNTEFSLARGMSYGGNLGFRINDHLGIETGLRYFQEKQELNSEDIAPRYPLGGTSWQFRSFNATPSIVLLKSTGRFTVQAKAGILFGLTSFGKSIFFEHKRKTFKFKTSFSSGYSIGLDLEFEIKNGITAFMESGIENQFYRPRKALLQYDDFSYWDMDELPVYLKEIIYVRKIDHEPVNYDPQTGIYYTNYNKPLMRMKETLKLNSVYAGIGIKMKFGKHAKN